jgi:redox-sensitive bicupin YhaK (pirin superfamily)
MQIRRSSERGFADHGWLKSFHTFSFADYRDPRHMGFGALRVINEDRVAAGQGFPTHGHRDMEIISYVLAGALAHKDSMGTGSTIRPGDVQRMSAGSGVQHSELNASADEPVHFLQIWIIPERSGLAPSYQQQHFAPETRQDQLRLIAAPGGEGDVVELHQDVRLHASLLGAGKSLTHQLAPGRQAWLQIARGKVGVGGEVLAAGDAAAFTRAGALEIAGLEPAELLLFDLRAA